MAMQAMGMIAMVAQLVETTTKVLGDLKERHLLQLRRGRIQVLDPVAVLGLAQQ